MPLTFITLPSGLVSLPPDIALLLLVRILWLSRNFGSTEGSGKVRGEVRGEKRKITSLFPPLRYHQT